MPSVAVVALAAVLLDVGGTLWPDTWPVDEAARTARLERALPGSGPLFPRLADAVAGRVDADRAVLETLVDTGLSSDLGTAVEVRRAMCAPFHPLGTPVRGAFDLLEAVRRLEKRCVLVSNVSVRDAELYADDLAALGWLGHVDGCITSIDVRCRKPGAAIFEAALAAAHAPAEACLMIGDSERNDIEPARALGIRTIRIGDPRQVSSADTVVPGPMDCIPLLERWDAAFGR